MQSLLEVSPPSQHSPMVAVFIGAREILKSSFISGLAFAQALLQSGVHEAPLHKKDLTFRIGGSLLNRNGQATSKSVSQAFLIM